MRRIAALAAAFLLAAAPAWADYDPRATGDAVAALAASIPTPATVVPPGATPTGIVGSGNTYIPSNAAQPSLTRSARTTTASDGTFSVTWATPLVSTAPVGFAVPIGTSTSGPTSCTPTSITSTLIAGKCWTGGSVTISALGAAINPFTTAAAGISISVFAREPTQ